MKLFIVMLTSLGVSAAFTTAGALNTRLGLKLSVKASFNNAHDGSKRKCQRCPETTREDFDLDRREALFAMMGSVWAATSVFAPQPANAVYGSDAKIELPNVVEGITQRVNQQCLVESLGNRECLVYLDPANKLYQGADNQVLLQRVEKASGALATIPELVESKKWSQISGVLTGPLGTLLSTMNQLVKASDNESRVNELAQKAKSDIFAIGAAAERKQGDAVLQAHKDATDSLVAFSRSL
jgi:hypothetical protein